MPNSTVSAAATGLPNPRRAFLRRLAALPLIGGGVTLIGQPTAVAAPVTVKMLQTYQNWLAHEFDRASMELCGRDQWRDAVRYRHMIGSAYDFHCGSAGAPYTDAFGHASPLPSTRAALVLSAVGCDWTEEDR